MIFRWWMAPVIGVGIVATANGVLIATAVRVRPQKSEARPYAESAFEDRHAGERDGFAARGWRLEREVDATGATLRLVAANGPRPVKAEVAVFRPNDAAADRQIVWADPVQPLRIELSRPGAWSLRIAITDTQGARLACEARLDRP